MWRDHISYGTYARHGVIIFHIRRTQDLAWYYFVWCIWKSWRDNNRMIKNSILKTHISFLHQITSIYINKWEIDLLFEIKKTWKNKLMKKKIVLWVFQNMCTTNNINITHFNLLSREAMKCCIQCIKRPYFNIKK